ncbi:hypothetical protein G6F42_027112 [Rhizopus arrhizus]|nr:hypothetical protein G6F42_027112 [Rhizopus arrhizus]
MARPRSDIGRLRHDDIRFRYDTTTGKLTGVILHFRQAKETQVKSLILGVIEDTNMCPVLTLNSFISRTLPLRQNLPADHTLFLGYLNDESKVTSIRPSRVSNWLKQVMQQAGIDTRYKAHSIRSAASTKAVTKGNTITDVKKHANWSLHTNTFETYYYKPSSANSTSTKITNSIFSPENSITLAAEAEETEIVVGTTNNQNVSEAEANNVINAHPWYRYW